LVIEASRVGCFLLDSDPESYPLGSIIEVRLTFRDIVVDLGAKVVRKQLSPRSGIAVHICRMTADEKLSYRRILLGLT
jgi:hypothetical protein